MGTQTHQPRARSLNPNTVNHKKTTPFNPFPIIEKHTAHIHTSDSSLQIDRYHFVSFIRDILRPYFQGTVPAHAPEEEVPPLSFFLFFFLTLLLYMGCLRDTFISSHLCRNGAYHSAHDCAHSTNAIPPLRSVWVAATS